MNQVYQEEGKNEEDHNWFEYALYNRIGSNYGLGI